MIHLSSLFELVYFQNKREIERETERFQTFPYQHFVFNAKFLLCLKVWGCFVAPELSCSFAYQLRYGFDIQWAVFYRLYLQLNIVELNN